MKLSQQDMVMYRGLICSLVSVSTELNPIHLTYNDGFFVESYWVNPENISRIPVTAETFKPGLYYSDRTDKVHQFTYMDNSLGHLFLPLLKDLEEYHKKENKMIIVHDCTACKFDPKKHGRCHLCMQRNFSHWEMAEPTGTLTTAQTEKDIPLCNSCLNNDDCGYNNRFHCNDYIKKTQQPGNPFKVGDMVTHYGKPGKIVYMNNTHSCVEFDRGGLVIDFTCNLQPAETEVSIEKLLTDFQYHHDHECNCDTLLDCEYWLELVAKVREALNEQG